MSVAKRLPRASLPQSHSDDLNGFPASVLEFENDSPGAPSTTFDLSLIIPTRNEAGNIPELWRRVDAALNGFAVECIFVDDSDDETPRLIESLAARPGREVVLVHRDPGDRDGGLGGAVVRGLKRARAPWAAVMDADLQHPPEVLPNCWPNRLTDDSTW